MVKKYGYLLELRGPVTQSSLVACKETEASTPQPQENESCQQQIQPCEGGAEPHMETTAPAWSGFKQGLKPYYWSELVTLGIPL